MAELTQQEIIEGALLGPGLWRVRANIISVGRTPGNKGVTRELLAKLAKDSERGDLVVVVSSKEGLLSARAVRGVARSFVVDGDDLWATLALAEDFPRFERAAAVLADTARGTVMVAVMTTDLSREDILRLNTERRT